MKTYVTGLMFSLDRKHISLICKNKPDWQKGLLNGIGGKIEESDIEFSIQHNLVTASQLAMIREFEEETGVVTEINDWNLFLSMGSDIGKINDKNIQQYNESWSNDFYRTFSDKVFNVKTTTDEVVMIYNVEDLLELNTIDNLKWIILLALDKNPKMSKIQY